jgi:Fe-Mn family superoxide dismutase
MFALVTRYKLPDLPYDYGALEPHISGAIMELHHGKHHKTYVEGANKAIDQLLEARHREDFSEIAALQRSLAFNVSGHVLHSLFWQNLAPRAGGKPTGALAEAIDRDFGSFDHFKKQLVQIATTVQGSGWAALVWEPLSQRLGTLQIKDHQSEVTQASVPLLVLDAWEHAYYLQYENEKAKFFDAVWNVWNWNDVARRYQAAQKLDLVLESQVAA